MRNEFFSWLILNPKSRIREEGGERETEKVVLNIFLETNLKGRA